MAENEAHAATRQKAAERLWQKVHFEGAGALRRCRIQWVRPAFDGRPDIGLIGLEADARLLRSLTWVHNKAEKPGPLDWAFADVLPQFTNWPVFHFEVVDEWPRAA